MNKMLLFAACVCASATLSAISSADTIYVTLTGQKSGAVKPANPVLGHAGQLTVLTADHSVVSPRDPQSGLPTGQRMHKPYTFRIPFDTSSIDLYRMLATNEILTSATFDFYAPSTRGSTGLTMEAKAMTIRLTNATISQIDLVTATPTTANGKPVVDLLVSMVYQKIEWLNAQGTLNFSDDWVTRR